VSPFALILVAELQAAPDKLAEQWPDPQKPLFSQRGFGRLLTRSERTVRQWVASDRSVPPEVEIIIRLFARRADHA
jgi:hypothetical protein